MFLKQTTQKCLRYQQNVVFEVKIAKHRLKLVDCRWGAASSASMEAPPLLLNSKSRLNSRWSTSSRIPIRFFFSFRASDLAESFWLWCPKDREWATNFGLIKISSKKVVKANVIFRSNSQSLQLRLSNWLHWNSDIAQYGIRLFDYRSNST